MKQQRNRRRLEMSWSTGEHDKSVGDDMGFMVFDDEFAASVLAVLVDAGVVDLQVLERGELVAVGDTHIA